MQSLKSSGRFRCEAAQDVPKGRSVQRQHTYVARQSPAAPPRVTAGRRTTWISGTASTTAAAAAAGTAGGSTLSRRGRLKGRGTTFSPKLRAHRRSDQQEVVVVMELPSYVPDTRAGDVRDGVWVPVGKVPEPSA